MADSTTRERWLQLLKWGTYGLIFVPVFVTAISLMFIPPLIVFLVLFIVGLVLLSKNERNGTIMLGILALLFLGINIPFLGEALGHPESATDFIPNVVGVLSGLVVLASATALLRNKGSLRAAATLTRVVVIIGVVAIAVSVVRYLGVDSDTEQEGDVHLAAENVEWDPESLEADGGGAIFVENKDLTRHTFTVEELEIEEELSAGQDVRVELSADPGEYEFKCSVPGHESMEGTLTIR